MTVPTSRAISNQGWTGIGSVPTEVSGFLSNTWLTVLYPEWLYKGYGIQANIPANSGRTATFEKPNKLVTDTTPLDEYADEATEQFSTSYVVATIAEYGKAVGFSRRADQLTMVRDLAKKIRDRLVPNKKDTYDLVTRDALVAGASSFQTTGTARTDVADALTAANITDMLQYLIDGNAEVISKRIEPSTGVGTAGANPGFICFGHEDAFAAIVAACGTNWKDPADYPAGTMRYPGEAGMYRGRRTVRFILGTNGKVWAGGGAAVGATGLKSTGGLIDVYALVMLAKDAYIETGVNGKDLGIVVQPLGSSGSADPFKKRGTIAWGGYYTATIADDERITRAEFGVAA